MQTPIKFLLIFSFLIPCLSVAQEQNSETENINALKDGILVVRLDMKQNVLEAYQSVMDAQDKDSKDYKRAKENYDRLSDERQRYKENVIKAMNLHYRFSAHCFIENQNMDSFISGDATVLEIPDAYQDIDIANTEVFFLIKGDEDSHWIICDRDFKRVPHPFPSSHNLGIKRLFDFFGKKDNFSMSNLTKVVTKMDFRLTEYYNRMN